MSSSGSVPMTTNSRHSHPVQTHSGMSKCDRSSRPPILAEPAHNNRVKAAPQNCDRWELQQVDMHACHIPQHASSPVCVSSPGASRW